MAADLIFGVIADRIGFDVIDRYLIEGPCPFVGTVFLKAPTMRATLPLLNGLFGIRGVRMPGRVVDKPLPSIRLSLLLPSRQ